MAQISDLYLSKDPSTVNKIQDTPTLTEPDSSFLYTAQKAIESPSRSGAWAREKMDMLYGATTYSAPELEKMYPDAPKGLFKHENTKEFAEYILERERANQTLEILKDYRSRNSALPNIARDIGYGILQNTGPLDIAAGAAIGAGIMYAAPVVGLGTLASGALTATTGQWATMGALDGFLSGTFGYLLDKQLEYKTQEKADPNQIWVGAGLGAAIGGLSGLWKNRNIYSRSGGGLKGAFDKAADDFLRGDGKIEIPEDQITRIPKGEYSTRWAAFDQIKSGKTPDLIEGKTPKLITDTHTPNGDVTMVGRIKYKTYSGAEYFPHDAKPNTLFALVSDGSTMTHNGAEAPFAGATYLSETSGDLRAYSSAVNQAGRLVEVPTGNLKIADLNKTESLNLVKDILAHYTDLVDGEIKDGFNAQELMHFISNQATGDLIQHDLMAALKAEGYDAIAYNTVESIAGRTFKRKHTFLFDGLSGKETKTIGSLDGTLGALPESVSLNNEISSKMYNLRYAEGITVDGQKISLDPHGYFTSDPEFDNELVRKAYIQYFDKVAVDEVKEAMLQGTTDSISSKYPQLTKEVLEDIAQVEKFSKIDKPELKKEMVEYAKSKLNDNLAKLASEDTKLYDEVAKASTFCLGRFLK